MSKKNLIETLFSDLESLSEQYDELTDTDVRESIAITLDYFFVSGKSGEFPTTLGMFSPEADKAVVSILKKFIDSAQAHPEICDTPFGQKRLDLLQDRSVKTADGNQYDLFIGYTQEPLQVDAIPEDLFHPDYES